MEESLEATANAQIPESTVIERGLNITLDSGRCLPFEEMQGCLQA
jgi:hypothetical protein